MTAQSRAEFADLVRAPGVDLARTCLLIDCEVNPDLDVDVPLKELDRLAAQVNSASSLREVLRHFHGEPSDYDDLRSSMLSEVLARGRGLPILLSVVWCEVARRAGLSAASLGKPGHVLTCVGDPRGDYVVVDPFDHGAPIDVDPAPVLDGPDLLLRVLTNIRALASRQPPSLEWARTRLWATELSLLLPRHPLELRRDRGELLVRLGDHLAGAHELEAYADASPSEEHAAAARRGARLARARLN